MKTIALNHWSEYLPQVEQLQRLYARGAEAGRFLYRGQADSSWRIQTTLERRTNRPIDVVKYATMACGFGYELRSATGRTWKTKGFPELQEEVHSKQTESTPYLPCYEYLVYLRQFGFPSPLLDWTESPLVAAYFAFCEASVHAKRIAVFAYDETPLGVKGSQIGEPTIHVQGPYVDTDRRHFAQQSWHSVTTQWLEGRHIFRSHDSAFAQKRDGQDILVQITLPSTARLDALLFFKQANISHFTLFQTEEALIKTMDLKVFDLSEFR